MAMPDLLLLTINEKMLRNGIIDEHTKEEIENTILNDILNSDGKESIIGVGLTLQNYRRDTV